MKTVQKSMTITEWLLLLLLSVLWGGSFFFGELALKDLPPLSLVLARVALAALVLNGIVLLLGQRMPKDARLWLAFFAMGALNNFIPFSLIFWGQTEITSGLASILNATTPLWTVVLAHFFTQDERLTKQKLVGLVFGLSGVVLMVGPTALKGLGVNALAQLAVLAAALSYAFAGIFGRRFKRLGVQPLVTAAGQLSSTTIMMMPVVLLLDRPWKLSTPSITTIAAVISLAVLCTALAYVIYFRLLATAGASNLLLVTFLIPVTALILGTGILGEILTLGQAVGMLLIATGLAAIDGRLWKYLR